MTTPIVLLACVPVEVFPTLPEHVTYSTYKVVNCPDCHNPMWLGAEGEKQVAHGARAICMLCLGVLMRKNGLTDPNDVTLVSLTDPGAEKA